MGWSVEGYCETSGEAIVPVVDDEYATLAHDARLSLGLARLVGWLKAVVAGQAAPNHEPEIASRGEALRYRSVGGAVVVFALIEQRLVVLRFARAASALPKVADLAVAAERRKRWRAEHGA